MAQAPGPVSPHGPHDIKQILAQTLHGITEDRLVLRRDVTQL